MTPLASKQVAIDGVPHKRNELSESPCAMIVNRVKRGTISVFCRHLHCLFFYVIRHRWALKGVGDPVRAPIPLKNHSVATRKSKTLRCISFFRRVVCCDLRQTLTRTQSFLQMSLSLVILYCANLKLTHRPHACTFLCPVLKVQRRPDRNRFRPPDVAP